MKLSLTRSIYTLLLLLPLSFKLKLSENVFIYPQEALLPIIFMLFYLIKPAELCWFNKSYLKPYYFLFGALIVVVLCTFLSFINSVSISGLLKTVKYLIYCYTIFLISKHDFSNFSRQFIRVGAWVVSLTLALFFYKFLESGDGIQGFYRRTMWEVDLMPSGFSNINFNLNTLKFERSTGNHGIYGSYLVLLYLFIIYSIKESSEGLNWKKSVYLLLITFNLFLLPSRESLIIFIIINLLIFIKTINLNRIRIRNLAIFLFLGLAVSSYLIFSSTEIVLISKLKYTVESFLKGGQESNISLRFNVWHLTLLSFILFPIHLLIGYGYNTPNFGDYLTQTNSHFQLYLNFASVPESFFFIFLSYGGIMAFILGLFYFVGLILKASRFRKSSTLGFLFFAYTIMLFITNNTGGSMLSDLLFAQYSLVYIYQFKLNEA